MRCFYGDILSNVSLDNGNNRNWNDNNSRSNDWGSGRDCNNNSSWFGGDNSAGNCPCSIPNAILLSLVGLMDNSWNSKRWAQGSVNACLHEKPVHRIAFLSVNLFHALVLHLRFLFISKTFDERGGSVTFRWQQQQRWRGFTCLLSTNAHAANRTFVSPRRKLARSILSHENHYKVSSKRQRMCGESSFASNVRRMRVGEERYLGVIWSECFTLTITVLCLLQSA